VALDQPPPTLRLVSTPTLDSDVAIVGAGPAGTTAATLLARAGVNVHVFDRASFPRDKCCGDGLTALALRELDTLGLDPASVASWQPVNEVVVRSPRGRIHHYPLPSGSGYHAAVARREELDAALVDLAVASGAKVHERTQVTAAEPSANQVTLRFADDRSHVTNHVIAADGMWSPLRKMLGLNVDGYRGEWHAFRQYFRNVSPRAASELVVWFERDLLPGYAWSFPLSGDRANIGFGIRRGGPHTVGAMKSLWPDLLSRPHVQELLGPDATPESPHKAWPIPARVGRVPLVGPNTLFVGDAAAVTDPMTGEGIGQAILTGRMAAEAILGRRNVSRNYEHAVRRELVADDRMARLLVPLLARPAIASAALRATGASGWTRRNFARWMFEDYPRAMLATPRRWHRGMFTGPGAYQG